MAPRFVIPKRFPITAASAGKRTTPLARFNSSSSTSRAARVMEMAAQAEKPSAFEASVPILWVLCGAAIVTAWNRVDEREDHVEKLLIV
ncbi:uncharacterized protein BDR25DRAFT_394108 [Lindgomyces ingoldianus]|uniref:Uncharacterized protein n=1 Tax=Lindgomyces ingoldianus TaxID=673940 RepID=A0ACB6QT72_9PLEO|nr:uncharacterized protein BDR25DRAFT_394108 [Lindgomyces ingoldianus]KAF2470208.1 hypothetical protein BDR25DRAFT_394108 [Lindgomyces ingoldianus]